MQGRPLFHQLSALFLLSLLVVSTAGCFGGGGGGRQNPRPAAAADRTCYGNIDDLTPWSSGYDVSVDVGDLNKLKSCYEKVADTYCIQASVIAGIASRESRGGRILRSDGMGLDGKAYGIMQCDPKSGLPCKDCPFDSCCHIDMMVGRLLIPYIKQVANEHPDWTKAQQMQGGVAAYNFGVSNVRTWENLDVGTTGDDYSDDVIARAKYLKDNHGWN